VRLQDALITRREVALFRQPESPCLPPPRRVTLPFPAMTTPELVAGVRQLFATAPEERTSRISPRARAPFPPPRAAAPVARVDSSGHAPWKANCCGQRAWPALTRPAGEDALRAQILANFRDRKMARFSDFTPIARPPSPPKVSVLVMLRLCRAY
jgi:hypothetical protein